MTRLAVACRWIDGVTGTTNGIVERTRRFAALGWEVALFGERLDEPRLRAAGGTPRRLRGLPWGGDVRRSFFDRRVKAATRGRFDLVEGHGDTLAQDVLMLHNCVHAAHEAVYGAPRPDDPLGRLHARLLGERRFRRLIANSELMKRDLVRRYGLAPETVRVIHPGHDSARFRPEDRDALRGPARAELGVGGDVVLVGLVTSGDFRKRGVSLFLRALARLRPESRRRLRALVAGKERRMDAFRAQARALGLGDRVVFAPPTPRVERLYHALDVLAYPAYFEEFGQSVQEAMACGTPLLASARVGAAELLPPEQRACLLERPDEEGLSRRLEEMIADPARRRRWGLEGAAAVRANDWDRNFRLTRDVYAELLADARAEPPV